MSSNLLQNEAKNKNATEPASGEQGTAISTTQSDTNSTQPTPTPQPLNENIPQAMDFIEKVHSLKFSLDSDILGCDAQWSLFVVAMLQRNVPKQLLPHCYTPDAKGRALLLAHIYDMPKLSIMFQRMCDEIYEELNTDTVDLLHYVLFQCQQFLETIHETAWQELHVDLQRQLKGAARHPSHIFEVIPQLQTTNSTKYAYFTASVACFHSIVHLGFQEAKQQPFYIYPSLNLALKYAPESDGWELSALGTKLACVAVCAYEDDGNIDQFLGGKEASRLLVNDKVVIKLRYLLFFGRNLPQKNPTKLNVISEWVNSNRFGLSVACYAFMLLAIGFSKTIYMRNISHYLRKSATTLWNSFINYL